MTSSHPPLTTLQAFEAVARRRSFTQAALEMHLTASAISHQIAKLEKLVGTRLIDRTPAGVKLSTAGEQYLQRISPAMTALASATRDCMCIAILVRGCRIWIFAMACPVGLIW